MKMVNTAYHLCSQSTPEKNNRNTRKMKKVKEKRHRKANKGKAFTIDFRERFYPLTTASKCLLGKPGLSQCLFIMENESLALNQLSQASQVTRDVR